MTVAKKHQVAQQYAGETVSTYPGTNEPFCFKWSSQRISTGLPIFCFRVQGDAFGSIATGIGTDFWPKQALLKAYMEAWERLIVLKMSRDLAPVSSNQEINSSNGCAAHLTVELAKKSARLELIERAILLTCWQRPQYWRPIGLQSPLGVALSLLIRRRGWRTLLYQIHEAELGDFFAAFAVHQELGLVFDSIMVESGMKVTDAQLRLLMSVGKSVSAREVAGRVDIGVGLPRQGVPLDHFAYYSNVDHLAALDFLKVATAGPWDDVRLGADRKIVSDVLFPPGDLPAVVRCRNEYWPQLAWGLSSMGAETNWPHPLA